MVWVRSGESKSSDVQGCVCVWEVVVVYHGFARTHPDLPGMLLLLDP